MATQSSPSMAAPDRRPPTVLIFSACAPRRTGLHRLIRAVTPHCSVVEAEHLVDAVAHGASVRLALAVLEHTTAQPVSSLVRVLRHQSPGVKVLVFAVDAEALPPGATRWEALPERLSEALGRLF